VALLIRAAALLLLAGIAITFLIVSNNPTHTIDHRSEHAGPRTSGRSEGTVTAVRARNRSSTGDDHHHHERGVGRRQPRPLSLARRTTSLG
jgi:hypothetical protein